MEVSPFDSSLRVLIVDDSSYFLAAARVVLERDGVTVAGVASTSTEALQLAAEVDPHVVVVDVDLGEDNGFDLAARLVAARDTRVVLTSVYAEADLAELIAASPAVGFVSKAELSAATVANAVRNAPRSKS